MSEIKNCARCGEDAFCHKLGEGKFFVRVRRISHCKYYCAPKKGLRSDTCGTNLLESEQAAISKWNKDFGTNKSFEVEGEAGVNDGQHSD